MTQDMHGTRKASFEFQKTNLRPDRYLEISILVRTISPYLIYVHLYMELKRCRALPLSLVWKLDDRHRALSQARDTVLGFYRHRALPPRFTGQEIPCITVTDHIKRMKNAMPSKQIHIWSAKPFHRLLSMWPLNRIEIPLYVLDCLVLYVL